MDAGSALSRILRRLGLVRSDLRGTLRQWLLLLGGHIAPRAARRGAASTVAARRTSSLVGSRAITAKSRRPTALIPKSEALSRERDLTVVRKAAAGA